MKRLVSLLFIGILYLNGFTQDLCTPVGWGTKYSSSIIGGGSANPTVCDTYAKLKTAISNKDKVIHISGTITFPSGGRITIQDIDGLTIFGLPGSKLVSTDLTKDGSGIFYAKRVTNFILQNVVFEAPGAKDMDGYDNFCIDDCQGVWVDHCEFHDGMDGNFDIKNKSDFVAVTWCTFSYEKAPIPGGTGGANDHRYTNLIGSSDGATADAGKLNTTFQYCWWGEGCVERMPRVRYGKIHMLNNYFSSSVASYCVRAAYACNVLVEGNYFENQKEPVDIYNSNAVVAEKNNYCSNGVKISTQSASSVFTPPYTYTAAAATSIVTPIKNCAGATLPAWKSCSSCSGSAKFPPVVSITSPINNANFTPGSNVTINATATDSDGTVSKVEFYNGNTLIGTATSGYSATISNIAAGTHTIKAIATDNDGLTATSQVIVNVSSPTTVTVAIQGLGVAIPDISGSQQTGQTLSTTAIEYIGNEFTGWTGDITSSDPKLSFTVTGNTSVTANFSPISTYNVFEFEDGYYEATYAAFENSHPGFSGIGYVNTVNTANSWTEITVYAQAAGSYNCEIFYSVIDERPINISVNGTTQITNLAMPVTPSWDDWTSIKITLELTEGANTIRITGPTASKGAPNLDKIHITAQDIVITYDVTLKKGWNLIGYPLETSKTIETALSSVLSNIEIIKDDDGYYLKSQSPTLNSLTELKWGKGYFIKVSQDCEFNW